MAYVASTPTPEEGRDIENPVPKPILIDAEVEDAQSSGAKKIKRGIYGGGYGYGHYPYYSFGKIY